MTLRNKLLITKMKEESDTQWALKILGWSMKKVRSQKVSQKLSREKWWKWVVYYFICRSFLSSIVWLCAVTCWEIRNENEKKCDQTFSSLRTWGFFDWENSKWRRYRGTEPWNFYLVPFFGWFVFSFSSRFYHAECIMLTDTSRHWGFVLQ